MTSGDLDRSTESSPSEPAKKFCSFCNERKPTSEFDKSNAADGLSSTCRSCKDPLSRKRVEPTVLHGKEPRNLGQRKRGRLHKDLYARDPLHMLAHKAVANALRTGFLVRPKYCEKCGIEQHHLEAHHHRGYLQEHWTDVRWLCKGCHDLHRGID